VLLGLEGELPGTVNVDAIASRLERIRRESTVHAAGRHTVPFVEKQRLRFHRSESLPAHPAGLQFAAFDSTGAELLRKTYYSISGGFAVGEKTAGRDELTPDATPLPLPFQTRAALLRVRTAMQACVDRSCRSEGALTGGLHVPRHTARLFHELSSHPEAALHDSLVALDWVSFWAMAANEENAGGGCVVTAPTNGAAGILPAVLHCLVRVRGCTGDDVAVRFLLTAAAIAILYKLNASI